jgi:MFS family permease
MEYTDTEVRAVKLACYISGFITPLLSTMMNLSLINIGEDFGTGSHDLAYVNSAFLLASVIFMVPLSKLSDIIGKKKMFNIGLVILIAGCVVASIAPSFGWVILGRAIIGVGAAGLVTVSISILTDVVPKEHRGSVMGYQTMFIYMGLALGPAIGGSLNDLIGWRLLFLLPIPLAVASIAILKSGFKGEITPDAGGTLDTRGSILYGMAVLFSMAGVMNLPAVWAIVSVIAGLILLVLFVKDQIGKENCILEMSLFKNWAFSGSCIATFMSYASSYSISFFMALYLQSIGQLSATEAGMLMIIQPTIQCIFTPFVGRLTDKLERKEILPTIGMAITALGVLSLVFYSLDTGLETVIATMVLVGFGFSLFSAPNTTLIMSSVPRNHTSEASGMMAVMRQTGMMVSMGIAMLFIATIMGSTDNLGPDTYELFLEVMSYSFTVCFVMCIIGTITSMFRGTPKKS